MSDNRELLDIFRELLRIESEKDSIELGAPTQIGRIKVYGDARNLDEFKRRLDNQIALAKYGETRYAEAVKAAEEKSDK